MFLLTIGYQLTLANKVYFSRELPLNSCIQLLLQDELAAVDFKNVEKTTNQINQWVKEKTMKKIPELLPMGALDSSTKMALVNAAYFKGNYLAHLPNYFNIHVSTSIRWCLACYNVSSC